MRLANTVIGILTLVTTVTAFVPWFPPYLCLKEGTCKPEKRAVDNELSTLGTEARSDVFKLKLIRREVGSRASHPKQLGRKGQLGTRIGPFHLSLRDRSENKVAARATVTASTPTQTNSAGIDQDGGDNSYFAEVLLGSAKIPFLMLLDSGASDTWIKSASCTSPACLNKKTYGPSNSTTLKIDSSNTFDITYGTGKVEGNYATDSISFAGLNVRMDFGLARNVSDTFLNYNFDGILGLAQGTPSFLSALVASKQLKSNIFGVSLSSADDGPNTSEISFGAPDPSKFTGSLAYSPINASHASYWTIPLGNAGYGNTQMGSSITTPLVYIDTGTTYIFAPPGDADKFYSLVPGAQPSANHASDNAWTVPCGTTTPLTFTFSGVTYSIPAKDWVGPMANGVCYSNLFKIDLDGWLLGDLFLKQVYTVFDVDAARIGFASATVQSTVATSTGALPTATGTGTGTRTSGTETTGSMTLTTTTSNAIPAGSSSRITGTSSSSTKGKETPASATSPLTTTTKTSSASRASSAVTIIMGIVLITAVL